MQANGIDSPRSVAWRGETGWWCRAACVGHDPEWWADDTNMLGEAVRICLSCPVRRQCLAEALRNNDFGVIRGGMFFERIDRRSRAIPLTCVECHVRPVQGKRRGTDRYCGPRCRAIAGARTFNDTAQ
jgi:Transcription factor WhiB